MKVKPYLPVILVAASFAACHNIVKKADDMASSTTKEIGQQVGEKSTQLVSGIKEGVDRAYGCTLEVAPALKDMGIEAGKFVIGRDSNSQTENKLSVYLVTGKAVNKTITARIVDVKGLEYGRTSARVEAKAGDGRFVDFVFDNRTDIEGRSKIVLE